MRSVAFQLQIESRFNMADIGVLPPAELAKIAKEELDEVPERQEADIKAIKDWMAKQPHLNGHARNGECALLR